MRSRRNRQRFFIHHSHGIDSLLMRYGHTRRHLGAGIAFRFLAVALGSRNRLLDVADRGVCNPQHRAASNLTDVVKALYTTPT